MNKPPGRLIVIAGPSGVGKGTLINLVLPRLENTILSVSATTRPRRADETDGREYFFLSREDFDARVGRNEFVEHVNYGKHSYGTLHSEVEKNLGEGRNVLLEIEVEGARNVRGLYPDAILIFIAPPSLEELERRLAGRQTETPAEIASRIDRAGQELAAQDEFDYIVINQDINQAAAELEYLIKSNLQEAK
jgi:guanylate kinase